MLDLDLKRCPIDERCGVIGIQQIAELCRAARRLREVARDAVAGHAQRNGADLGLVVADVPVIPLDDQLGVDLAKAEQGHPAAVLGDLDGGGAEGTVWFLFGDTRKEAGELEVFP